MSSSHGTEMVLEQGFMSMLKFFRRTRNMRLDDRILAETVIRRDVLAVQVICDLDVVESKSNAADIAAIRGNMEILELLYSCGALCSTRGMDGSAEEGHLGIVQFLHEQNAPCTRRAIDLSVRNGHVTVVEYLLRHRREGCSPYAMYWVCALNHVTILQWLLAHSVTGDLDRCIQTAKMNGHVEIVNILEAYRQFCPTRRSSSSATTRRLPERFPAPVPLTFGHVVYDEIRNKLGLGLTASQAEKRPTKRVKLNHSESATPRYRRTG